MKKLLTLLLLSFAMVSFAQINKVQKDTSFTIASTLIKEQKKRPYITVASPRQAADIVAKTDIVYKIIQERQLQLDIYYPRRVNKKKPAVLLIFGGGWRSGDKSQNQAMAISLANKGYVAASPEYRLSPEAAYPAAVYDLKAAIKWMKTNAKAYGIDTNKIAVLGCSAGGQLAALIGTTNNNHQFEDSLGNKTVTASVNAVIDIDGILAFHHPESAEGVVAGQWLGGSYEQRSTTWQEASALQHINKNTVPFLFINSSLPRFHAGRDDMIKLMDSFHIYTEVHTMDDTPHPFWFFNPWFDPMMGYVFSFLKKMDN